MPHALLIIDVQEALFRPEPRPADADIVVERINALARAAREQGASVIFVQHASATGDLAEGSPGWRLLRELDRQSGDYVVGKMTADSFLRTGLAALLEQLGVSSVTICGYASEFCIDTTVRQAAARGYEVVLVSDAHTTHDKPHATAKLIRTHHNMTLPEISSFGPRIIARPSSQVSFAD